MKYRKRPVVVEAVRWWPPGDARHVPVAGVEKGPREDQPWGVMTREVFMEAVPWCWIITGVEGEVYPCADSVFRKTYEEVA